MELTPRQLAAIDIERASEDGCVVAGPGSGKTLVLVERYKRLVLDRNVPPARILAITFTEKAARNMKDRLAEAFRDLPEKRRQIEQANISTIHGFCARLLRENSVIAGIDPDFRVLDARQATIMQGAAASDALETMFAENPEAMKALIHGLSSPDLAGKIPEVYDAMRCAGVAVGNLGRFRADGPGITDLRGELDRLSRESTASWTCAQRKKLEEVIEAALRITSLPEEPVTPEHFQVISSFPTSLKGIKQGTTAYSILKSIKDDLLKEIQRTLIGRYYSRERETLLAAMVRFDDLYSERKRRIGALDYSDLESFTVRLLETNAGLRARVQAEFQHILMDEFQDTNGQQAKLTGLLRGPARFYAVGDINQSIYGFRHADPDLFRAYRDEVEDTGQHLAELAENFRSRPEILRAVEAILANAQGIEPRRLIAKKDFRDKLEPSVELIAAIADNPEEAAELEGQWVARRVLELAGRLPLNDRVAGFGDMAVLMRNTEALPAFTRSFDKAGIPYLVNQGKGFFETREVVDLVNLLRAIANPRDEISLAAVLRSPFVGVSDEALLHLKDAGNLGALRRLEHIDADFDGLDRTKLRNFRDQLQRWREAREVTGFDRLLMRVIDETGAVAEPGSRASANVEKFLSLARQASSRLSLCEFVDELDLMREADARDVEAPLEDTLNAVRVMTVHAAKGLEFPVVFLAALQKGVQSGAGSPAFSPRVGLGARWNIPGVAGNTRDHFLKRIEDEAKTREKDESNRLLYVAMTRAEEHLVLSLSSCGKLKEWASTVEAAIGEDLTVPHNKILPVQTPYGETFPLRLLATKAPPALLTGSPGEVLAAGVQVLARPAVEAQHDSAATVTALARFADCPRRYYLEHYIGLRSGGPRHLRFLGDDSGEESEPDELDASEFGRAVHALLAGQIADAPPEAQRLAAAFRSSELGQRTARATHSEREFDFVMAVEDIVVRGQIDLWFEEGGGVVLVDYKTDDVSAREADARAEYYAPQLRIYAAALENMTGKPVKEAFLYFLRPGVETTVSLERTLLNTPESLVREFSDAQSRLDFPLREGEHCSRCPFYRGLCPAGSAVPDVVHAAAVDGEDLAGDEAGLG